ncbi:MAG: hypothetical protein PHQ84_03230 [Candidatus Omnitrophica bacterium]|nr:hypothetical protein [Candidatus Omnitrophota bacterium]
MKINKIFFLVLICACFAAYGAYLHNDFVLDDRVLVLENPFIKSAQFLPGVFKAGLYEYWTGPQAYDRMFRPLQMLSYYFDYRLWGLDPAGYRFTNLILHLLSAFLVFYLIFKLFKDNLLAGSCSLIFLLHPVQISSVVYISARGDLLSGLFILSSCAAFIKFMEKEDYRFYLCGIAAAALALLSRENALLTLFFLMLIGFLFYRRKLKFRFWAGFIVLYACYFLARIFALGPGALATHPVYFTGPQKLINFANVVFRYLLIFIWPVNLGIFHLTNFIGKLSAASLSVFALCLALIMTAAAVCFRKLLDLPAVFKFSFFWFLIGMLPVFLYFDAYPALGKSLMAESWLYLPLLGLALPASYFLLRFKKGALLVFAWAALLGMIVIFNSRYWKSEVPFYRRAMRFLPEDNPLQRKLAEAYLREGELPGADEAIRNVEKYHPDSPAAISLRGDYYLASGSPEAARDCYRSILVKGFLTDYSMSLCYSRLGERAKAIEFGRESFRLNPFFLPNIVHLSGLYREAGDTAEAERYSVLAQRLDPKNIRGIRK